MILQQNKGITDAGLKKNGSVLKVKQNVEVVLEIRKIARKSGFTKYIGAHWVHNLLKIVVMKFR